MTDHKDDQDGGGQEPSIGDIDRVIHEPARFMLMSYLYVVDSADFLFLMRRTGLTFGNLSSHMSRLEEAGYIAIDKEFVEKKPHTRLSLTEEGRGAFQDYRQSMMDVLDRLPNSQETTR